MKVAAPGFPERAVRLRARFGARSVFPMPGENGDYGHAVFGAEERAGDEWDGLRIVPPVFVPGRLAKMIALGREPHHTDVDLATSVGGFRSPIPLYVSAMGSTNVAHVVHGPSLALQAATLGIPLVLGENIATVHGYATPIHAGRLSFKERARAYADRLPPGSGGLVVQQSTEDADAELWNHVYSDPAFEDLLASGRLGFELKVGQGAKPGLGGLTLVDHEDAARLRGRFQVDETSLDGMTHLRSATPGTFTPEILRSQIRLMKNNFPRCRVWVKLPPGRDVAEAALVAWKAGADAVAVDGAEAGTGFAPNVFLDKVGLSLLECLRRIGTAPDGTLLASGRFWEGSRIVKTLALGATAVGIGRAAIIATDEDPTMGFQRFIEALSLELRLLVSALGKYEAAQLSADDVVPRA